MRTLSQRSVVRWWLASVLIGAVVWVAVGVIGDQDRCADLHVGSGEFWPYGAPMRIDLDPAGAETCPREVVLNVRGENRSFRVRSRRIVRRGSGMSVTPTDLECSVLTSQSCVLGPIVATDRSVRVCAAGYFHLEGFRLRGAVILWWIANTWFLLRRTSRTKLFARVS